uniref:Mediator of RNA polymerase II transcription subunit 10 n=1 Tax=Elaeophora elaphi TaxID=1147741 RepID=A0A0R3RPT4_9BILA
MTERYMPSIFPECDKLKQIYDKCFSDFFEKFISTEASAVSNPCGRLHETYRHCIEKLFHHKIILELEGESMDPSLMGSMSNAPVLQETATDTRYNQLEQTLENFQENARQMGVIASDFTTRSQEPLNQKIHTLISGLHELDHLKNQFMDVKIPLELLEYLDQGKNPQLYTKECLERTLNKNKEMNGKIEMYKKFRAMLLKELGEEMPNDMILYRNLRDRKDASPQHENYNEDASD